MNFQDMFGPESILYVPKIKALALKMLLKFDIEMSRQESVHSILLLQENLRQHVETAS